MNHKGAWGLWVWVVFTPPLRTLLYLPLLPFIAKRSHPTTGCMLQSGGGRQSDYNGDKRIARTPSSPMCEYFQATLATPQYVRIL